MVRFNFLAGYLIIFGVFLVDMVMAQPEENGFDSKPLRDAVTLEGIRTHQQALQDIATQNSNNRMTLTKGYRDSVNYVERTLQSAGYHVVRQDFSIFSSEDKNPPSLIKKIPSEQIFVAGVDFASMSGKGQATVEAMVEAVDLSVPSPEKNHSTSGCEMEDFAHFTPGNIALIQRGSCTFVTKVENAIKALASGVIIFNEGNPEREGLIDSRITDTPENYPVVGATFQVGDNLRNKLLSGPTGNIVTLSIDVQQLAHPVQNIIAETSLGDATKTTVVGAHLDSVREGPGMNDNASGSATILEIAKKLSELKIQHKNKIRFIWFGAEEFGLLGSEHYVHSLSKQQRDNIMAMLNFDMLNSPNYVRFVYDGSHSHVDGGSALIENIFLNYFSSINLQTHPTAFDGRSDYGPFIEVGIPAGGLFSGAEGRKSREMAAIYGGVAGKAFDPCYHRACDNFANTSDQNGSLALQSLDELSDAATHATLYLATIDLPPLNINRKIIDPKFEYKGPFLVR